MTRDITKSDPKPPAEDSLAMASPLSSRALFWKARYLTGSGFLPHLPLAFWLVETCRPTTLVELGADDGLCFFALCQAVERLNLPARCYGYGAPGSKTAALTLPEVETYAEFARLEARDPVDALSRFDNGSIDLLVVDMALPSATLETLCGVCLAKLSDRAVLLLRNVSGSDSDEARRELTRRLVGSHPAAHFEAGTGAVVAVAGADTDHRLRQLAGLRFGTAEYNIAHQVFDRVGAGHRNEWLARNAEELRAQAKTAVSEAAKAGSDAAALQAEVDKLSAAYLLRTEKLAELQSATFDAQHAAQAAGAQIAEIQARLDDQTAQTQAAEAKIAEVQARLDDQTAQRQAAEAQTAEIQARLEDQTAQRQAAEAQIAEMRAVLDAQTAQVSEMRALLNTAGAALEAEREARRALEQKTKTEPRLEQDVERMTGEIVILTRALDEARKGAAPVASTPSPAKPAPNPRHPVELALKQQRIDQLQSRSRFGRGSGELSGAELRRQIGIVAASPHFDTEWYRATYPDVHHSGIDPARHFLVFGLYEGRKPSADFDPISYYIQNPAALEARINPLVHLHDGSGK